MFFPYCSSSDGSHSLYVMDSFPKALPSKSHAHLEWSPLNTGPQKSETQPRKKTVFEKYGLEWLLRFGGEEYVLAWDYKRQL